MTDNTPNRQPENQAAHSEPAIETQTTKPQTQPEKPAEPVAQSAPQKQPEKQPAQQSVKQPVKQQEPAPQPQPIVIQQKSSGGRGIATGALVLSLIALGASGFLFVQGQNVLKQQEMRIGQDLNKAALGNSENAALLQSTLAKQAELDAQLSKILQNESDTAQTLDGIHRAYAELLKGRVNWLVDEIEVTLNTASQQLLLSGNVPVATAVLENVEQRLSRFEQPELLPIKQAISQDLAALKNRPYLNVSATALRLDRLESAVDSLPLLVDSTMNAQNAEPAPTSKAGSFWTRAWDNTSELVKSMVEVRKLDNNDAMLIGSEQVFYLRENLRMRLLDARLALLQHNSEVYQNDLAAIEETVKRYFDVQSPNTQTWLKEVGELKSVEIRMISDESLKASLAAVRDYQNNVRTALPVVLPESKTAAPAISAASAPKAASEPTPVAAPPAAAASEPKSEKSDSKAASQPASKPAASEPATKPANEGKGAKA
ncbi:uroporphyrinogen-III C-methyltransferase [Kingella oralis]|uniref:uroporphyrinogen-III C-methyltransferase n=1 Tax=Kingella oralis TaxID=505 RepID=UPI0034E394D0